MRLRTLLLAALSLALIPSALVAETEAGGETVLAEQEPARAEAAEPMLPMLAELDSPKACFASEGAAGAAKKPASRAATCTADCWDGSTRTCEGSECTATDSACPGERGSCSGSTTGTLYCPRCCEAGLPCTWYEGRSCSPNGIRVQCAEDGGCGVCRCFSGTWGCS